MPPVELVVFDMDGVLADTEPLHLEATNVVLGREGARLSEDDNRQFLGTGDREYFAALKQRFGLAGAPEEYVKAKTRALLPILAAGLVPNPGVCELLLKLKMDDVPAVVASSSVPEVIKTVVESLGLARSFRRTFSGVEVPRPKPAPDLFLHAARTMGVAPANALVIEDAPAGIQAARDAGMRVVGVRTEQNRELMLSADVVVESLVAWDLSELGD